MRAHAPGSVTGFFVPPSGSGGASRGASMAIADGVVADVEPAPETTIRVADVERGFEPVELLLADLGVTACVEVEPEIPIGYGFGASGAATLATALAANAEFELGHARETLLEASHRAEVEAGTGLGDVFIQDRGGVIWSTEDGSRRVERTDRIEYDAMGGMATEEVLADERTVRKVRERGEEAFTKLPEEPTLRRIVALAWEFAHGTGLVTERVAREVERVEAAGGAASMAMLGETVFAVGVDGVLSNETRVTEKGARLL